MTGGRKGPKVSTFLRLALCLVSIAGRICIRRVRDVHLSDMSHVCSVTCVLSDMCAVSKMCAVTHIAVSHTLLCAIRQMTMYVRYDTMYVRYDTMYVRHDRALVHLTLCTCAL